MNQNTGAFQTNLGNYVFIFFWTCIFSKKCSQPLATWLIYMFFFFFLEKNNVSSGIIPDNFNDFLAVTDSHSSKRKQKLTPAPHQSAYMSQYFPELCSM